MGDCNSGSCSSGSCSSGSCSSGSCSSNEDRLPPGILGKYDLNQDTGLGVLMWIDKDGESISKESLELLGKARKESDDRIFAMITGPGSIRPLYDILFSYGVDTLYHIRCKEMEEFDAQNYAKALADLSERLNPMCILISATERGNIVAERTGMILGRQVHRDCTSFSISNNLLTTEGSMSMSVPMFTKRNIHPIIATVIPGSFGEPERFENRKGTAISRPFKVE